MIDRHTLKLAIYPKQAGGEHKTFRSPQFQGVGNFKRSLMLVVGMSILLYLFWNTGIHGDDYSMRTEMMSLDVQAFLNVEKNSTAMMCLSSYYMFWWAYPFVDVSSLWIYDVAKWIAHILAIWLVFRFAIDYLPKDRAFLLAVFFVFNPMHETTEYWYGTIPYILAPALIMYAHSLIRHELEFSSLVVGMLGSFMGYMSPPYAFGLATTFFLEKAYKKAIIFLAPGITYVIYYFSIAALHPSTEHRVQYGMTLVTWLKNCVVQIVAFLDSAIGPSFFLKIWWSISSISLLSLCLAIIVFMAMLLNFRSRRGSISVSLLLGLVAVLVLSFGMVSLADIYGHRVFNLGNRLSVYGALLTTFLVMSIPHSGKLLVALALVYILPSFGLSDHWKSWNAHQKKVIETIRDSGELSILKEDDILLVSGNMYSRLGPFSHIDFFNMPWVVTSIFEESVKTKLIMPLNTYAYLDGDRIVDPKSSIAVAVIRDFYVYDSEQSRLIKFSKTELPEVLGKRPPEIRHWAQLMNGVWVESGITYLGPRLAYIFSSKVDSTVNRVPTF